MDAYHVGKMGQLDRGSVLALLEKNQLNLDEQVDYTAVLKHRGQVIGTCSYKGNVLKSFAVQSCYQGGGGGAQLLTHVMNRLFDAGHHRMMAYTLSNNRLAFEAMHFKCLYDTGKVALMLNGGDTLATYLQYIQKTLASENDNRSAIVMNGNPFTKGHLALVETAAANSGDLLIFVVQEDSSTFSFKDRLAMIEKGTAHLKNVHVFPGGDFMVSMATFPNYFVRDASQHAQYSAELDAGLFGEIIGPALGIKNRYVGTEPYCSMTLLYNEVLQKVLHDHQMNLCIIERKTAQGVAISASLVRQYITEDNWAAIGQLVPETTLVYLNNEGVATCAGLKNKEGDAH